jgi:hypothetical protein
LIDSSGMASSSRKTSSPRHGDSRPATIAELGPLQDWGCLLVLTKLLAAPLPMATAIDRICDMASAIGWHPVGDVILTAMERCRDKAYLRCDNRGVSITPLGRRWLSDVRTSRPRDH